MLDLIYIIVGVALLYYGGENLVQGSVRVASSLGISRLVIGLTVVAFGTSSPELASTLIAIFEGAPDVALGNVLGSNIANIGLILGLSALLKPLVCEPDFVKREIPFMIFVGVLLLPLALGGGFGRLDGLLLLALFCVYLWVLLRSSSEEQVVLPVEVDEGEASDSTTSQFREWMRIAVGIALLVIGAKVLVPGAVGIAQAIGLSEQVIGLTLVAVGTSLPELAASVIAVSHGEGDLILGNVIGSNIFNVLLVLGTTALVHPVEVDFASFRGDLIIASAFGLFPLILLGRNRRLGKVEGGLLLLTYLVYAFFLFRSAG
ncbi:MAG: calcium/sodium antiporter [Deltaproteobacteria bacterium]|nr:calcium/sodium antiporter [Deltaproteobacteria bacterium]